MLVSTELEICNKISKIFLERHSSMNPSSAQPCSCGGENPTCYKCDGTGLIEKDKQQNLPGKYSIRGIPKAGETSPEELLRRASKDRNVTDKTQQRISSQPKVTPQSKSSDPDLGRWKPTSKPYYRCAKCSYKWNRDPNARCAWCNELGSYEVHYQQLG